MSNQTKTNLFLSLTFLIQYNERIQLLFFCCLEFIKNSFTKNWFIIVQFSVLFNDGLRKCSFYPIMAMWCHWVRPHKRYPILVISEHSIIIYSMWTFFIILCNFVCFFQIIFFSFTFFFGIWSLKNFSS
jgi:hypothetical protein